jgi:hypothetical protein
MAVPNEHDNIPCEQALEKNPGPTLGKVRSTEICVRKDQPLRRLVDAAVQLHHTAKIVTKRECGREVHLWDSRGPEQFSRSTNEVPIKIRGHQANVCWSAEEPEKILMQ